MNNSRLAPPNEETNVLLHCCCAPCSGGIIASLLEAGIDLTILFYNPNIHPKDEYEKRKADIVRYAQKLNIPLIDSDYDPDNWLERVQGLENEPERGRRCSICFDMRLEYAALYAAEHHFKVFTSTFGISRWKDMAQVNAAGERAAARYPDPTYWTHNWRKKNGTQKMYEVIQREEFYRQKYCGCVYSKRHESTYHAPEATSQDPATKSQP